MSVGALHHKRAVAGAHWEKVRKWKWKKKQRGRGLGGGDAAKGFGGTPQTLALGEGMMHRQRSHPPTVGGGGGGVFQFTAEKKKKKERYTLDLLVL